MNFREIKFRAFANFALSAKVKLAKRRGIAESRNEIHREIFEIAFFAEKLVNFRPSISVLGKIWPFNLVFRLIREIKSTRNFSKLGFAKFIPKKREIKSRGI